MARKLLIFHDSPDFGGHERMFLGLLPGVIGDERFGEIAMTVPAANARLQAALRGTGVRTIDWPFLKGRGEPYFHRLRRRYRAAVRDLVARERPDIALLVQGRIENCAVPMLAVPREVRLVSYVPMAHRMGEIGRAAWGDAARRPLYARPDHFIVPGPAVIDQVRRAGGRAPVSVAHNVVDPPPSPGRASARADLGLAPDARLALFLGRLDPAQKGLDRLLAAIARGGPALQGWTFLFVGDGPGRALVETTAAGQGHARIAHVPWTDRPHLFLAAADALLLPSRWEGLPLVLLEALAYRVPVLAEPLPELSGYLPETSLARFDTVELCQALEQITAPSATIAFAAHAEKTLAPLSLSTSRRAFADALIGDAA